LFNAIYFFFRHFWQKLIASHFGFDHSLPAPPAAMRQFAAPLWLDIETPIWMIILSFSGWFHDPRITSLDLAQ
jgi:hypothetical protein